MEPEALCACTSIGDLKTTTRDQPLVIHALVIPALVSVLRVRVSLTPAVLVRVWLVGTLQSRVRPAEVSVPDARMRVHSGAPFWLVSNGLAPSRPALPGNTSCDVVVWGAGVTGALVADRLTQDGLDVVVLDRRESGVASTAASTALIQYDIDLELRALADTIGADNAARAYRSSADAVRTLATTVSDLEGVDFHMRPSLYLASTGRDARRLRRETEARAAIGLDVEWMDADAVSSRYGFTSHGAIRSALAGEVDALAMTRALLTRAAARGARWYEQTHVRGYEELPGGVRMRTNRGATVDAKFAVCATGYLLPSYFDLDVATLHSTFALATQRVEDFGAWDDGALVWESARPYSYMRTTADRRVIIGGEDVPFKNAALRDRLLPGKVATIEATLRRIAPSLATETAYSWTGTFAETDDGLPYIGSVTKYPGLLFALGYGGNGITFSVIAADILSALCRGRTVESAELYAMTR